MKVTFLIGNGFDKNLGLQTLYKEFIKNKYIVDYKNDKNEIIRNFKEFINKTIDSNEDKKFNSDYWKDVEIAFGDITSNKELFHDGNEWQICYDSFCNELSEYLKDEENKINYDQITPLFFEDIQNFYDKLFINDALQVQNITKSKITNCEYNFINFNYTLIIDKIIELKNDLLKDGNTIGNIYHIHGDLKNGIILGVDNEGQIANKGIFNSLGSYSLTHFIKPRSMNMKFTKMKENAHQVIVNSDIIIIYGCSLGETDKTWRDFLCESIRAHKMIIFTKKDDLIESSNINTSKRDFFNVIEKTHKELSDKICLFNYFNMNGFTDHYKSVSECFDFYRKQYLKYGHMNLFANLKLY